MRSIIRVFIMIELLTACGAPAYAQKIKPNGVLKDKEADNGDSAQAKAEPKDFTNVNAVELGVKPVEEKKDAKTGFVVGGKNTTALIEGLTEINGRSIEALENDMRPLAIGLDDLSFTRSALGFLGPKERLLDVLAADNRFVVDDQGLTHQELATHLPRQRQKNQLQHVGAAHDRTLRVL